jgi:2',3'-cyclic-nucleotide 2'-phosphodiesterase (5'-nucleotidase family)
MHRPTAFALAFAAGFSWSCASAPARPGAQGGERAPGDSTEIVVAATTDVHGRLRGWDYFANAPDTLRGLTRAATIIDSVRQARPGQVVLVDAGDLLQGSPPTYVAARVDSAGPHPVIAAMNAMQYDAAALGNHEFNYGLPTLTRALSQARFPFLAANAYRPNGTRAYDASRIVTRGGVRIAIVGATTPGAMIWDRDNLAGRLEIRDIVPEVAREVRALRDRADAVVVVMHSGLGERSSYDTAATGLPSENVGARVAREVPGVDLIVIGHSHREVADTVINGVTITQPRNWATSVALATLSMVRDGERWRVARRRGTIVRAAGHAEHPAVVAATQRSHDATMAWVNQTLGTTPVAWRADSARVSDTPLIDFLLDVQRRAAGTDLASTAAFDLNATLDAGPITVAEVARLYPFENTLRAVRITGKQLREYLEFSARYYRTAGTPEATASPVDPTVPGYNFDIIAGADYTLDLSRPLGSRVTRLEVKGRAVADGDSFTMALNNYRQTGGGGYTMLNGAPVIYDRQEEIRDLLIAEVRRRGTLRPEDYFTRNWELVPAAAGAAAYRAMHGTSFDASGMPRAASGALGSGRWLRIIATNDFHGAFEPRADAGGIARGGAPQLATAIARARAECPPATCTSLWLDGGDEFQGTPASNLSFGATVVELFGRLGLSASALGNHEFDWGIDTLRARMQQAPYAILGANVRDAWGEDVPWIRNDTLIELPGVRVGVIGVATVETPAKTRASNVAALRFVAPAPIVDQHARALRARGADVVIVIAHAGGFCDRTATDRCVGEIIDLAGQVTEKIDAIVSGHTHSGVLTRVKGIPIIQSFSRGSAVGTIDLPLAGRDSSRLALRNVRPDSVAGDPAVAAYTDSVLARTAVLFATPVATIGERIAPGSTGALGNLVADAQRWAGKGDVAVMNRGGVRAPLNAGVATTGSLFEVQPFGNVLVRIQTRGADLRAYLERILESDATAFHLSGVQLHVDRRRPVGSRITRLTFSDGRPFDPRRVYRLVMTDFLAAGGDGLGLSERAIAVEELGIVDVEALADYLRSLPSPVRPPRDARLVPVSP